MYMYILYTMCMHDACEFCTLIAWRVSRDLSNNDIKRIDAVYFRDCPLGGSLSLANNDIAYIEDGTFAHVTSAYSMCVHA